MKLTSVRDVADIMNRHGLKFNKGYGQNFLINEAVPKRIAAECGADPDSGILEIGPGIGTLTRELCARYRKVVAVEIDSSLIPALKETTADLDNLVIINDDIMKTDLDRLISYEFAGMNVTVCANLPYYITTPIIMKLLESDVRFDNITVMIQKEVAARLTSKPGEPDYGAITASVARYGTARRLFTVSAGSFIPAPKVDSAVIRIETSRERSYTVKDEKNRNKRRLEKMDTKETVVQPAAQDIPAPKKKKRRKKKIVKRIIAIIIVLAIIGGIAFGLFKLFGKKDAAAQEIMDGTG